MKRPLKVLPPVSLESCAKHKSLASKKCVVVNIRIYTIILVKRTLREMRILLSLTHENIIDIKDFICEDSVDTLKDIYIIQVGYIHALYLITFRTS